MKSLVVLILILIIGSAVRIYGLNASLPFWSDSAADLLITEKIWNSIKVFDFKNLPLAGPTVNTYLKAENQSPGISHGIGYYYFLTIPAILSSFNPYNLALLIIFLNIAAIYLLYVFIKQISEEKTALLGSFLLATSAYAIAYSRISWNVNSVVFFSLLSILTFTKILQGSSGYWSLFSFFASFLTQIHILGYPFVAVTFLPLILLKRVNLPKGKLAVVSLFLFLLPQFPSIWVFFNKSSSIGTLTQYLISIVKDFNNLGAYIIFLLKYIPSEFLFAGQLNNNFLNIPVVYWVAISFIIIICHLIIRKLAKLKTKWVSNPNKILFISWSFSSLVILFLSKTHLERGNNYILVFVLPLFIFLFAFLIRYAFRDIILVPAGLIALIIYLYCSFSFIGDFKTVSLQDHKQLASFLSTSSNYELYIPEAMIQESIYWVILKAGITLPQRVNGTPNWVLPISKQVIKLNNYPVTKKYAIVFVDFKSILPNCLPNRRLGFLSLYNCNEN